MRAYDSMSIIKRILEGKDFQTRDELESYTRNLSKLTGLTGEWKLVDGIWLKDMAALKLHRGAIKPAFGEGPTTQEL